MRAQLSRRKFLTATARAAGGALALGSLGAGAARQGQSPAKPVTVSNLPVGSAPLALDLPHFPHRLHAFVWRNWQLVPGSRLARVVGAKPADLKRIAKAMGLPRQPQITADQWRRSALTIIKRNWHLLPYEQLLDLLGWTPEQMAFSLREDDFLYVKLGNLKPQCGPLRYSIPAPRILEEQQAIRGIVSEEFPRGLALESGSLFSFVHDLSARSRREPSTQSLKRSSFTPRFCYSYFALYGDPLLDSAADPYPEGYLARLADAGVDGVWLQGLLTKLAPFPWDASRSAGYQVRLRNLRILTERARRHGVSVYLYLNEPRARPLSFYDAHPELKGVQEGEYACLCTSKPEVEDYLRRAMAIVGRAVPELGGVFTITASENLTHCWSHYQGNRCPRCRDRGPAQVIGQLNRTLLEGLREGNHQAQLIAWDWGWQDDWAAQTIQALPVEAAFMSVSEWSLPINRGGVESTIGEYSISAIGPGPRALRHWKLARERGLKTIAKIQAGNTWELSAVPYIPALKNVAQHAANLREARVDGLMLGWTLGGYPSPNLEAVAEIGRDSALTPVGAMEMVARRRFGPELGPKAVQAWTRFSDAFSQYPFGSGLYSAPLQLGPANLLWLKPTGYAATMVGFPYDDLNSWCGNYPPEVFAGQLEKVATGFYEALRDLKAASVALYSSPSERAAFEAELGVAEAAAIHFRSASLQCRFVLARRAFEKGGSGSGREEHRKTMEDILHREIALARRMYELQSRDPRLGFEASNQYYYVPLDLVEKVLNCRDLLQRLATAD